MATAERLSTAGPAGMAPPHNLEAEQSVLGAILLSERSMFGLVVEDGLRPEDFYRESHGIVFEAMLDLYQEGGKIDAVTLTEHLKQAGQLDAAGGEPAIYGLSGGVPAAGHVRHYAGIVKENALLRNLLTTAYDIQASVHEHRGAPRELVEWAERAMLDVAHDGRQQEFKRISEVLELELEKLQKLSKDGAALTGTPSGFTELDALTGGFQPGNLIVLAARPGMGKSALVTNMAENASLGHGRAVALFSLEMSETELAQRFVSSQARVRSDDLRKGKVAANKWPKILEASAKLAQAHLFVDDTSDLGILEIRAKARRLHSREPNGLGLIIVDYLQLMRADHRTDNRAEQVGQMSRGLKILARELNVPVIALSQLNRALEARTDKRPLLSDLRESGCLTGDSRVFMPDEGIYRRMEELVGEAGFRVLAIDPETWRIERRAVTNAFSTGHKDVFALRTRSGRQIKATANHRFLTVDGWRRLDELSPGDLLSAFGTRDKTGSFGSGGATAPVATGKIATAPALRTWTARDVLWDEIAAIEPAGNEEVYDLTVEGLHNFVAEDIVVHNSIEQDADVVMFIYRDSYYDKESEDEGKAEIIVSKHRNGPQGKVILTFRDEYVKFMNFIDPGRFEA